MKREVMKDVLWLTLAGVLLFFSTLWIRPLGNPDEGRYAEIPTEMLQSGDWVTPRLNGVLYFEKPPMVYWTQAIAIQCLGENHVAYRFSSALFALLGVLATYLAGRAMWGRRTGLLAAGILATSVLYFGLSQIIILDMAVSGVLSFALLSFWVGRTQTGGRRRWLFWLAYACMALAVLTKGLIGMLIPGAILFLWSLLLNRWKEWKQYYLFSGFLIFFVIALPWHLLATLRNPGFAWFYFVNEHFLRYLTTAHSRVQPFWFFFVIAAVGFIPWIFFMPQALKNAPSAKNRDSVLFLSIWAVFVLFFFSLSQSKLIPYILPMFCPLALLLGRQLDALFDDLRKVLLGFWLTSALFTLLALAGQWVLEQIHHPITPDYLPLFRLTQGVLLIAAVFIGLESYRGLYKRALAGVFVGMAMIGLIGGPLFGCFQRPSTRACAEFLKTHRTSDAHVFQFYDYYQDFPVYLGEMTGVALHFPEEQSYGLSLEPQPSRHLSEDTFWPVWRTQKIYGLIEKERFDAFAERSQAKKLFEDENFVVFSND
ncbi:MAG: hypothetical protein A2Y14_04040 [Verrucomicrobia bacterium GWF2_51_19]|nr:MAG: hypothetical protein A2Y14_04040 [Verrucomicrobia bacterium GWF2_51_19]